MTTINGRACVANGRNLLLDTDFNNLDLWYANQYWTKQPDKYNGFAVMQTTVDWNGLSQYVKVKTGEVYTFSVYARYASGNGTSNIYWLPRTDQESGHARANASVIYKQVNLSENWQRISVTTTITADGYIRPRIERTDNNSNVLQIAGMKLETGTLATPLTPVPVDKVFSNGAQLYGRNLLTGTGSHVVTGTGTNISEYISNETNNDFLTIFKGLEGKIVTISVDYEYSGFVAGSSQNRLGWEIRTVTDSKVYFGPWYYPNNGSGSGRMSSTFVVPKNITEIGYANGWIQFSGTGTGTLSHLKLEKGRVPTPWTPAPEDVM